MGRTELHLTGSPPVLSTDSCTQQALSECHWTVRRSPDLQVTKSLLCMQPGVVGEEVPYPRCSNHRATGMTDLDYIPTPNAIGHSWAYQREPLFCGHTVSQMWLLHAAEGCPEGQTEAMAYSS